MPAPTQPNPPQSRGQLLESVQAALMLRHYSSKTIEAHVAWVRRFVIFHHRRHPSSLGAAKVAAFPSHLAAEAEVSASTQNQALAALLFLYSEVLQRPLTSLGAVVHAKRPARLPTVMSHTEVDVLLSQLDGIWRLMTSLLYGLGLRLLECASLRVKDIDFDAGQVLVRRGKGQKDRATLLARSLIDPLGADPAHLAGERQEELFAGTSHTPRAKP